MSHRTAGAIGTLILGAVAVLSYVTAFQYFSAPRLEDGTFATLIPYNFTWLPFTETLRFDLGILLDPISVMMLIVISTVSLMVHIYSFGYMKGETGFQRYYAFLSLFTMSMLGLVVATNIFQMYLFWELVGVSSYLLIGFYYTKPAAIAASKKAFIVTRFADLGFLIGILIYGYYSGTFGFTPDTVSLISGGASMLPLALGLMFIGGAGKSAMFPLHIWLPDAMEGPTGRCFHRLLCSKRGLRTIGYQTCAGLLDHFTDWFYDGSTGRLYFYGPAPRRTGIYGFHVPPLHTRHV